GGRGGSGSHALSCWQWMAAGAPGAPGRPATPAAGSRRAAGIAAAPLTCEDGHLRCRADPACPLDGRWGAWGPWSPCSHRCREGAQVRVRACDNPAPQHGGRGCAGGSQQQRACRGQLPCEGDGAKGTGAWSPWGACSVTCGGGEQIRTRECLRPGCQGLSAQSKICNTQVCLGEWPPVGCPAGRLYRECLQEEGCPYSCAHLAGQMDCFSDGCEEGCHCPHGQLNCSLAPCPLDGGFGAWSPWTSCSRTCGGLGNMTRARSCTRPAPAHGGRDCAGPRTDTKYCQTPDCAGEPAPGAAGGCPGSRAGAGVGAR
uniref:Uncharacterized protein n=1 Tax=Crocodylus porosus TaxID=8502 RepID=A0A7M4DZW2_CROPO